MTNGAARNVLITGASSGIGAALARRYAMDGAALALTGRNRRRLDEVAAACRAAGAAAVETHLLDVREREAMAGVIADLDGRRPLDLVIANAGITGGAAMDGSLETATASRDLIDTNVLGTLNTLHPVLPAMIARGSGQIGVVSSIAAFVPLPGAPTYCASKAAGLAYALALRATLRGSGVKVSALCPGYVDTPLLSQLAGNSPVRITPDEAAARIHAGLAANRRIVAFPPWHAFITRLIAVMPEAIVRRALPSLRVSPLENP